MKFAATATAGRFAAFSAQRVDGTRQEGIASEGGLDQRWQEILEAAELGAECTEGVEAVIHGDALCGLLYINIKYNLQNRKKFREKQKKAKKKGKCLKPSWTKTAWPFAQARQLLPQKTWEKPIAYSQKQRGRGGRDQRARPLTSESLRSRRRP